MLQAPTCEMLCHMQCVSHMHHHHVGVRSTWQPVGDAALGSMWVYTAPDSMEG